MPKFYCEYCGIYLTHSSPSGRGQHAKGRKHINNRIEYYKQVIEDVNKENQDKIKQMQASHQASAMSSVQPLQFPPSMQSQQQMQMLMQLQHLSAGGISQMQINNKSAGPLAQPGLQQQPQTLAGAGGHQQIPPQFMGMPPHNAAGVNAAAGGAGGAVPSLRQGAVPPMMPGMVPPPHMMGFMPPNMMGGPGAMPPQMMPPQGGFVPPPMMGGMGMPFGQPGMPMEGSKVIDQIPPLKDGPM